MEEKKFSKRDILIEDDTEKSLNDDRSVEGKNKMKIKKRIT